MAIKNGAGEDVSPKRYAQDLCITAVLSAQSRLESERPANMTDKQYEAVKVQMAKMVPRANRALGNIIKTD